MAVAEQPDLVLVEDPLPMVSAEHTGRQVRRFAPATVVVCCVPYEDRVPALVQAGAATPSPAGPAGRGLPRPRRAARA